MRRKNGPFLFEVSNLLAFGCLNKAVLDVAQRYFFQEQYVTIQSLAPLAIEVDELLELPPTALSVSWPPRLTAAVQEIEIHVEREDDDSWKKDFTVVLRKGRRRRTWILGKGIFY